MNNTLRLGKKALTYAVVAATLLWSVGFAAIAAPLAASAADATVTLNAGDVVKGKSSKAVFLYGADGNLHTFPSAWVYLSWYPDWSGVKTLPDSQVAGINLGSTVAYRPGTRLVKVASANTVYAIEPGPVLRPVGSESVASALYGANWAKMIDDVDPSLFAYVYPTKGAALSDTATYPAGAVVQDSSGTVWLIGANKTKQKVTTAGQTANWVQSKFVLSTSVDLSGYTAGADVTANVPSWTTVVATASGTTATTGGTTTTPAAPAGTGLTVALASNQPAAATIVSDSANGGQGMIPMLALNFTASNDGDINVTSVNLKRGGISADTDFGNLYLYADNGTRLASNPSVASGYAMFSSSAGLFTVSKGTTKLVWVKMDLKNNTAAGKTMSWSVNAATDVKTTGTSTNVLGSFPLSGNSFTTALVSDLGKLAFSSLTPSAAATVNPGTTGFEIWRFQAANTAQDIQINKLSFTIIGSVGPNDLQNFKLFTGGTQVGSTVTNMATGNVITFDFSAAPYIVTKGLTKIFSLQADIVGGATRTFRASFQQASDIITFDRGYNVFLKTNGTDSFTVLQPNDGTAAATAVNFTVNGGSLTQTLASDSPNANVAKGVTNVTLAKFLWSAVGEDMKVSSLSVSSTASNTGDTLANLKLVVNGSQVGTTLASYTMAGAANTGWGTFGNSFIIKAGTTATVTVAGDLNGTLTAGDTFTVGLSAGSSNAQGMVSLGNISTVAQNANTLTVKSGTVALSVNSALGNAGSGNPTGTANGKGVKIASFIITGGVGEPVDLSQVVLKDNSAVTCPGTYVQNLVIKNSSGVQLGATVPTLSTSCATASTYTFNISPVVVIPAGQQYQVDVFADLKASLTTATALLQVDAITATGDTSGTSASLAAGQALALQQQYIGSAGTLTINVDPNTPLATNLVYGATAQTVGKFKLTTNGAEAINITQFVISVNVPSGATGTLKNITLYDDQGNQVGNPAVSLDSSQTSSYSSSTYAGAYFSGTGTGNGVLLTIPANITKGLTVKADITPYAQVQALGSTGQTVQVALLPFYNGTSNSITASGSQSGTTLTVANGGLTYTSNAGSGAVGIGAAPVPTTVGAVNANQYVLYRSKISIAWDPTFYASSGTAAENSAQTIGQFTVSNLANAGGYSATVQALNFNLSTTLSNTAASAGRALTVYKSSITTANQVAVTTFGGNLTITVGNTSFANGSATGQFNNVEISAGTSQTFFVTLDTTNTTQTSPVTKTLSVYLPASDTGVYAATNVTGGTQYGVSWADSSISDLNASNCSATAGTAAKVCTTGINASDNLLPLLPKTFSYSL